MNKITFGKLFKFFFLKLIPSFGLAFIIWYMGLAIIYYTIVEISGSAGPTLGTF